MSRVDSSKIAVRKVDEAGFDVTGSVLASDAFFPFRDGVDGLRKLALRRLFNRVARSGMRKLLTRLTNTDSRWSLLDADSSVTRKSIVISSYRAFYPYDGMTFS